MQPNYGGYPPGLAAPQQQPQQQQGYSQPQQQGYPQQGYPQQQQQYPPQGAGGQGQDTGDYVDPFNVSQMQNDPLAHADLNMNWDADANAERRPVLPASDAIFGHGKGYRAHVQFMEADRAKRWKRHTKKKDGTPHENPFYGAMIQYTVIDSPEGRYDGQTVTDYVMTMTRNGVNKAQGVIQAAGLNLPHIRTNEQLMQEVSRSSTPAWLSNFTRIGAGSSASPVRTVSSITRKWTGSIITRTSRPTRRILPARKPSASPPWSS